MKIFRSCLMGAVLIGALVTGSFCMAQDLDEVKASGVLRHIGVPYANFVTGSGDGMDVELMRLFADYLGVKYVYVPSTWKDVIGDLSGKRVKAVGADIEILGDTPIKGDVIANGFTQIAWREKIVDFSTPVFPSQIWLMARADSPVRPIVSTGDVGKDIEVVKALIKEKSVLGVANTCLEPSLYQLKETGAEVRLFNGNLNEVAPAIMNKDAETSILDVPDALVALEKWPGELKVIGPISQRQFMGCAFRKDSIKLREAFNAFLEQCKKDGTYLHLVQKYYPAVFDYYKEFFAGALEAKKQP